MKKFLAGIFALLIFVVVSADPSPVLAGPYEDCLAKGNTPTECRAATGFYNQNVWVSPNAYSQGQEAQNCATGGDINADCMTVFWVRGIATALGGTAVGYPGLEQNAPAGLKTGAAQFFAQGIDFMAVTRPASSIDYLAYMGNKLSLPGLATPAYAAQGGFGFTALTPVLTLWTISRNLAYLAFAIIFIVVGVLIMLRVKIDPKTAASIQSALPKIIFALIIVTFSYAIAGFLIDIMSISIGLIVGLMKTSGLTDPATAVETNIQNRDTIFHFFLGPVLWGTIGGAAEAVGSITDQLLGKNPISGALGFAAGGLAWLIIAIAVAWALFRTWLTLLGAYVNITLGIIFAPLRLMLDAIPGQDQFGAWVRDLLANLLSFPVVITLMFIAAALATSKDISTGFVPPLIGGGDQAAIQALVGLGILLTIPKVVEIMREIFKAPAFKYGTAWSEAIQFGQRPVAAPFVAGGRAGIFAGRQEAGRWIQGIGTPGGGVYKIAQHVGTFVKGKP